MENLTSHSQPGKQWALTMGCAVVGLALTVGYHDFTGPDLTNSMAGFLLGLLLLVIGILPPIPLHTPVSAPKSLARFPRTGKGGLRGGG